MRHKYETRGLVMARTPLGEANALITILTPELGLVRARAQGIRRCGAKLAPALSTFAESSLVLVRGQEVWRIAGAVLEENWFVRMEQSTARAAATRVSGLLLRLVAGEAHAQKLYPIVAGVFEALASLPSDAHENAEMLAVLRILATLGHDSGSLQGDEAVFSPESLASFAVNRSAYVARINHGITSSGL